MFREEFSADLGCSSLAALNLELKQVVKQYNESRPHHPLKLYTPIEYNHHYLG